jgi:hypothetical protein
MVAPAGTPSGATSSNHARSSPGQRLSNQGGPPAPCATVAQLSGGRRLSGERRLRAAFVVLECFVGRRAGLPARAKRQPSGGRHRLDWSGSVVWAAHPDGERDRCRALKQDRRSLNRCGRWSLRTPTGDSSVIRWDQTPDQSPTAKFGLPRPHCGQDLCPADTDADHAEPHSPDARVLRLMMVMPPPRGLSWKGACKRGERGGPS